MFDKALTIAENLAGADADAGARVASICVSEAPTLSYEEFVLEELE